MSDARRFPITQNAVGQIIRALPHQKVIMIALDHDVVNVQPGHPAVTSASCLRDSAAPVVMYPAVGQLGICRPDRIDDHGGAIPLIFAAQSVAAIMDFDPFSDAADLDIAIQARLHITAANHLNITVVRYISSAVEN